MRRTSSRISVDLSQDPRGRGGRVGSGVAGGARRGQSPPQERRTARRGTTTSVPMRPSTSLARRRRRSRPPARRRRREAERGAALISGLGHHAPSCVSLAPPCRRTTQGDRALGARSSAISTWSRPAVLRITHARIEPGSSGGETSGPWSPVGSEGDGSTRRSSRTSEPSAEAASPDFEPREGATVGVSHRGQLRELPPRG